MNRTKLRPVIDIYEESASFWAKKRAQSSFSEKKYMKLIMEHLSPDDTLLDIGCGTGFPIADYFLQNDIAVTGVDAAHAMIKIAKERFPQGKWEIADMRTLKLDRQFQAIVAWDSFFHLNCSEQEQMFPIFKEHLSRGGMLIFTSGPERGEAIGDMNGNPLFHSSLSPEEYRNLLKQNGFEVISYTPNDNECTGHTVWVCRLNFKNLLKS